MPSNYETSLSTMCAIYMNGKMVHVTSTAPNNVTARNAMVMQNQIMKVYHIRQSKSLNVWHPTRKLFA